MREVFSHCRPYVSAGAGIRHSRHPLPIQLRSLCHSFYEVQNRRFPDEALDNLGTVLFLRFVNPALGNAAPRLGGIAGLCISSNCSVS